MYNLIRLCKLDEDQQQPFMIQWYWRLFFQVVLILGGSCAYKCWCCKVSLCFLQQIWTRYLLEYSIWAFFMMTSLDQELINAMQDMGWWSSGQQHILNNCCVEINDMLRKWSRESCYFLTLGSINLILDDDWERTFACANLFFCVWYIYMS